MLTKIWVECHDLALNLCMSNLHSIDTNLLSVNLRAVASPFLWVTNELELVASVVETCERAARSEVKKEKLNNLSALLHHASKLHEFFRSQNWVCWTVDGRSRVSTVDGGELSGEIISWTRENVYPTLFHIFQACTYPMNRLQPCNVVHWPTFHM